VAIYSTFLQRAYDQILTDVCLQELPVVFVLDRAGIVGGDGPTHHGAFDLSYLRHMPNMVLMVPKDEKELRDMVHAALKFGRPCAIRYPRGRAKGMPKGAIDEIELGTWETLKGGKDLCLIACGNLVQPALDLAHELEQEGVSAMVINGRFVKPIDESLLEEASQIGRIVTLEENTRIGGLGAAILECVAEKGRDCRVKVLGLPDRFLPHGTQEKLRADVGLSKDGIKNCLLQWLRIE
jgi:1-deoxy-D-xylulose-5-phosphate synthase